MWRSRPERAGRVIIIGSPDHPEVQGIRGWEMDDPFGGGKTGADR
ncbi:MAG: hypothetical protein V8S58_06830 [Lachnospiraceae bacterium]